MGRSVGLVALDDVLAWPPSGRRQTLCDNAAGARLRATAHPPRPEVPKQALQGLGVAFVDGAFEVGCPLDRLVEKACHTGPSSRQAIDMSKFYKSGCIL